MFGLGFLLLTIGLSGVANIQETRRIHEQILLVENNYRHVESLVEAIRSDVSRLAVLRRDRLLEADSSRAELRQAVRASCARRHQLNLDQLRILPAEQRGKAFDRLETALHMYFDAVDDEFRRDPVRRPRPRSSTTGSDRRA